MGLGCGIPAGFSFIHCGNPAGLGLMSYESRGYGKGRLRESRVVDGLKVVMSLQSDSHVT